MWKNDPGKGGSRNFSKKSQLSTSHQRGMSGFADFVDGRVVTPWVNSSAAAGTHRLSPPAGRKGKIEEKKKSGQSVDQVGRESREAKWQSELGRRRGPTWRGRTWILMCRSCREKRGLGIHLVPVLARTWEAIPEWVSWVLCGGAGLKLIQFVEGSGCYLD